MFRSSDALRARAVKTCLSVSLSVVVARVHVVGAVGAAELVPVGPLAARAPTVDAFAVVAPTPGVVAGPLNGTDVDTLCEGDEQAAMAKSLKAPVATQERTATVRNLFMLFPRL